MKIANVLSSAVVGRELHRTDARTTLTFHLTGTRHMDIGECLGHRRLLGRYPVGDGSHGTERAPGTWGVDERQDDAYDGGHHDNRPEHATYAAPHGQSALAPGHGECQLDAEHAEDEEHHEQAEAERAHECRYWPVG